MKSVKIGYSCYECKKPVRQKHFTSEDGRILCYKCRIKEKAMAWKESALGNK